MYSANEKRVPHNGRNEKTQGLDRPESKQGEISDLSRRARQTVDVACYVFLLGRRSRAGRFGLDLIYGECVDPNRQDPPEALVLILGFWDERDRGSGVIAFPRRLSFVPPWMGYSMCMSFETI